MADIPPHLLESLQRYIDHGVLPGAFLCAVIANDLYRAFARADEQNRPFVGDLVLWLWDNAPGACRGSWRQIDEWVAAHRQEAE